MFWLSPLQRKIDVVMISSKFHPNWPRGSLKILKDMMSFDDALSFFIVALP